MTDNDFFTKLARLTPVLLFTADSRGYLEFVNERWTHVTGAPPHELLGDGWTRFVHPDDLLRLTPVWQHTVRHGRSFAEQSRFLRPDGTYRWIEIRAEPERDERGEIVRWIGSGTDVDGERRTAHEQAEWERHLIAMYEREHRVARSFQEAALPARLPDVPGFRFDAMYEASHSEALVGGDWYDAFPLPDGRIVVSIGDVAGSGLQAAVTMSNVRQAIRGIAHVRTDPAMMLQAADNALQGNEPNRYVTAFVGVIDPVAATLSYAGAGHPPPYVRDPNGALDAIESGGPPLGVPGVDKVTTVVIPFGPRSMLVLYTDGLIESTHNVIEGDARLRAALSNPMVFRADKPAVALRNALLAERPRDDVAILVVESLSGFAARRWTFDVRDADDARRVREQVLAELRKGSYPPNRLPFAELILAELTANVFRHASGPSQIVLEWDEECPPVLHVIDVGPGFHFDAKPQADLLAESGRGLYLVSSLAADVQVLQRQDGGSHARVVLKN
ncbi:MAG: ATP-binding SpoIIE family protein phosphatase [Vulcanimicrobiaceae bacterium]